MRPSSSPSEGPPPDTAGPALFGGVFARGPVAEQVGDTAWLQAMLDVEAALARAAARAGVVTREAASAVTAAARAERFDVSRLGAEAAAAGNPAAAVARALADVVPRDAAAAVHVGATSQDVVDTAMMLVAARATSAILADVRRAADGAAALAENHSDTLMVGRTLLQQALPITFGLKAAGWLTGLDEADDRLADVARTRLAVQLGGAVGTLASLGARGLDVAALLADELGLGEPVVPWHTARLRVLELAAALTGVTSALGKVARDVTLLAQPEIGEVHEAAVAGRGGSSTMPHKHNPVAAIAIVACARRAPGLLATIAVSGEQEHERAAGAWPAEWETIDDLLRLTGSAAAWGAELLTGLEVDADRMRDNLDATRGVTSAELVVTLLAPTIGRGDAHELVAAACDDALRTQRSLADALLADDRARDALDRAGVRRHDLDAALDPTNALGSKDAFLDRALDAHEAHTRDRS